MAIGHKVQSFDATNEDHQLLPESFSSFLESTSLHGARFLPTGNVIRRAFWTLALGSCFGFCTYQVFETTQAYFNRPFNTKITTKTANDYTDIPFPAVSICNFNFMNHRRFKDVGRRNNFSDELIEEKRRIMEKLVTDPKDVLNNKTRHRHPEFFARHHGQVSEDKDYFALYSYRIEDMLLPRSLFQSCLFNGIPCGPKNFVPFTSTEYGRCYTFNSGRDGLFLMNATIDGHSSGLKLLLNIERDSYIDIHITPFVGISVLVHDQRNFPLMAQYSFAVEPGHRTLCAIKRKKIINLPSPYSTNCSNESLSMLRDTGYKYSKPACLAQCMSLYIIKKCGCRPIEYPDPKLPLCAPNDTSLCLYPMMPTFATSKEKDACKKKCQQPCEHTEFETSLSYAGLHRSVFIEKLSSSPNITNEFPFYENFMNMSYSEKKDYIDDNIISLDVYFGDLSFDEIEQIPVFETWTLISSLGGNFGLFLGISILTFLEFIDFALRRMCFVIWKH